jgi:metal-responsive CopG/Arc/MetJ family transcriptional regulator
MNTREKKKFPVNLSLDLDLVKRIDRVAAKCGMTRSEFIANFMEITLESQEPVIDFGIQLGRVSKFIWPDKSKGKLKSA